MERRAKAWWLRRLTAWKSQPSPRRFRNWITPSPSWSSLMPLGPEAGWVWDAAGSSSHEFPTIHGAIWRLARKERAMSIQDHDCTVWLGRKMSVRVCWDVLVAFFGLVILPIFPDWCHVFDGFVFVPLVWIFPFRFIAFLKLPPAPVNRGTTGLKADDHDTWKLQEVFGSSWFTPCCCCCCLIIWLFCWRFIVDVCSSCVLTMFRSSSLEYQIDSATHLRKILSSLERGMGLSEHIEEPLKKSIGLELRSSQWIWHFFGVLHIFRHICRGDHSMRILWTIGCIRPQFTAKFKKECDDKPIGHWGNYITLYNLPSDKPIKTLAGFQL